MTPGLSKVIVKYNEVDDPHGLFYEEEYHFADKDRAQNFAYSIRGQYVRVHGEGKRDKIIRGAVVTKA